MEVFGKIIRPDYRTPKRGSMEKKK